MSNPSKPGSDKDSDRRYDNPDIWDDKEIAKEINDFSDNRLERYLQPGVDSTAYDPVRIKEDDTGTP